MLPRQVNSVRLPRDLDCHHQLSHFVLVIFVQRIDRIVAKRQQGFLSQTLFLMLRENIQAHVIKISSGGVPNVTLGPFYYFVILETIIQVSERPFSFFHYSSRGGLDLYINRQPLYTFGVLILSVVCCIVLIVRQRIKTP